MKKIISLLLAAIMVVFTLAACGKAETTTAETSTTEATAAETNGEVSTGNDEHVSFTLSSLAYVESKFDDPMYQYACEKFNFDISQHYEVTWADWTEKTRIWIASGDMPDATWWYFEGTPQSFSEYKNYVEQGLIKQLPEDWKEKYPNLAAMVEATGCEEGLTIDGKLYAVPLAECVNFAPAPVKYEHNMLYYRKDLAKQLGMEIGDTMTLEQLKEYVTGCKELRSNEIGLVGDKAYIEKLFMRMENPYFETFCDTGSEYVWGPGMEESYEGLSLFKEYYDNGVIDHDFHLKDATAHYSDWASGLACCMWSECSATNYQQRVTGLTEQNPDLSADDVGVCLLLGPDGNFHGARMGNFFSAFVYNPNIDDVTLDRILQFQDWMCTTDGQLFTAMGVPGVDWEEDGNGSYNIMLPKDEDGNYVDIYTYYPFSLYCCMSGIMGADFQFVSPTFSQDILDVYNHQFELKVEQDVGDNFYHWNPDLCFVESAALENYSVDVSSKFIELVTNSGTDTEAEWKSWVNSVASVTDPVVVDLNAAFYG